MRGAQTPPLASVGRGKTRLKGCTALRRPGPLVLRLDAAWSVMGQAWQGRSRGGRRTFFKGQDNAL
jgi:hypothetical protein